VTLPAGDGEILDRLRERCDDLQTRSAGASCLPPPLFDKGRPAESIPRRVGPGACISASERARDPVAP
jgi:hypothetical protein